MYEGYFLELEKYIAAAKLNIYFIEDGGEEEIKDAITNLKRASIVVKDLIEELRIRLLSELKEIAEEL